jgi:PmbA protein
MSTGSSDLMALADRMVALGVKKGADEIEVTIGDGSQFRAGIREGALETLTEAGSRQLAIRAFVDGRTANASSSDLSIDTLDRLVANAVARARLGGKDEFAGLPELEKVAVSAEELGIFDPAILALTPEEKIAYATAAEAIGLKQAGVTKSLGASFVSADETTWLANSKGFRGSYRSTIAYATAAFQAGEGDNLFQDGWFEGGPRRSALPEAEVLATTAARRVTRLIGARKVETQKVPVVVEPSVTAGLLDFLAEAVSGQAVDRRQSFLVDKLGTKIAADTVTIVDDGLLKAGFGTAPFDGEGVPRRTTTLVEAGVLKSYLLDTYYGRKLGMKSTGNAGGTTNLLGGGPHQARGDHGLGRPRAAADRHHRLRHRPHHRRHLDRRLRAVDRRGRDHVSGRGDHDRRQPRRPAPGRRIGRRRPALPRLDQRPDHQARRDDGRRHRGRGLTGRPFATAPRRRADEPPTGDGVCTEGRGIQGRDRSFHHPEDLPSIVRV